MYQKTTTCSFTDIYKKTISVLFFFEFNIVLFLAHVYHAKIQIITFIKFL